MQITINGEARSVVDGITVAALLDDLGLQPKYVAVERNLELIPRGQHADCRLTDDDALEIVTLVGGG